MTPTKILDLVLDETANLVAIQTDEGDCRKTNFSNSLLPVNIFFSMFDTLTDYEGLDQDGLYAFKMKQFNDNPQSPKFYFLFDQNRTFTRSRLWQKDVGQYDFDAILPLEGRIFLDEDWYSKDCTAIEDIIMEDSKNFASFMYQLVLEVVGN